MKSVLRKPRLHNYRNANHLEFHRQSYLVCLRHETEIQRPDLIHAYQEAVEQEEYVFNWMRRSEFTQKKRLADRRRDKTCAGLSGTVRVNLKHFDPAMRNYAGHVYNLLQNYGHLTNSGYDAQTAAIDSLIARLRGSDYAEAVQALGLRPWIDELENRNGRFKTCVEEVAREHIAKPDVNFTAARRTTDEALRRITTRITAQIDLDGATGPFAAFADEFNQLVRHYNTLLHEHLGRLHARIDLAPADIDTIEPQPFTGKPVFVIPAVSLRTDDGSTGELLFTRDFTLAYRNNAAPGTATIIIRGAGAYTGEIITTFNIAGTEDAV
jgi:hypothetical protein